MFCDILIVTHETSLCLFTLSNFIFSSSVRWYQSSCFNCAAVGPDGINCIRCSRLSLCFSIWLAQVVMMHWSQSWAPSVQFFITHPKIRNIEANAPRSKNETQRHYRPIAPVYHHNSSISFFVLSSHLSIGSQSRSREFPSNWSRKFCLSAL